MPFQTTHTSSNKKVSHFFKERPAFYPFHFLCLKTSTQDPGINRGHKKNKKWFSSNKVGDSPSETAITSNVKKPYVIFPAIAFSEKMSVNLIFPECHQPCQPLLRNGFVS